MAHNPTYDHGAALARADRHYNEPARYRARDGAYQFRTLRGTWEAVTADLEATAKGYLDTFWGEALYV